MSRQNKVNPGMYTQRGRLTQDDAARELRRQREFGAPHSFEKGRQGKLFHFKGSEPIERTEEEPEQAAPVKRKARKAVPGKAKAKAAKKAPAAKTPAARKSAAKKVPARKLVRKTAKPAAKKAAKKAKRRG